MLGAAFLFPGQGSQYVGMGQDFYNDFPQVKSLYHQAEDILGFSISKISFQGPEETLKQTQYTQPALYILSYAIASVLREKGIQAEATAGHSLGEFSSLAFADVFTFEDGLELVRQRGNLMQKAGEKSPGSMAAIIGLDNETVIAVCQEAQKEALAQPANFNAPGQVVISGSEQGIENAITLAKEKGARRALKLPVSGAFHSPLMNDAAIQFGDVLAKVTFQNPTIPVYANVTAFPVSNAQEVRDLLYQQLTHSVQWVDTINNMIQAGISHFIEVGAGKVLAGLVKRINPDVKMSTCGTVQELEQLCPNFNV